MTKPSSIETIETATGIAWEQWVRLIDSWGGRELSHTDIAGKVYKELEGKVESAGWWSQGVTVAYEQHIGRRVPGQRIDGSFEFSISKTFDASKEATFDTVVDKMEGVSDFRGVALSNTRTSITPVRSYWKCDLADGTKLTYAVEERSEGKATLVVTHAQLPDETSRDMWRDYWKDFITRI